MGVYEKEEVLQYPKVWYFVEDCLDSEPKDQKPLDGENSVYDDKEGGVFVEGKGACSI